MPDTIAMQTLQVGALGVNCYVLRHGNDALVIDPGADEELIEDALKGATLKAVLLTHAHFDHIGATQALLCAHPDAVLYCSAESAQQARDPAANLSLWIGGIPCQLDAPSQELNDGSAYTLAGIELRVFAVPGHMPGQLCFYVSALNALFSGDTVFAGSIGRSDFPGGNGNLLREKTIAMLQAVPPQTAVYPGHGPATTAKRELTGNPYLVGDMF